MRQRIFLTAVLPLLCAGLACRGDVARVAGPRSPALLADNVAAATTQRPIMDFVNAQTNVNGWTGPAQPTGARGDDLFMLCDYAGVVTRRLLALGGPDLGTTFSGTVTERPLPDGSAEVHVVLHTENAFANGRDLKTFAIVFGHSLAQVVAGADAAIGTCDYDLTFVNTAPGAPLPDLAAHAVTLDRVYFRGRALGTLRAAFGVPDGTPGRGEVVENGLADVPATADSWPAELVMFKVLGS